MAEYISREGAVDAGYLSDWYISSVGDEPPVWTDAHIDELLNDFIVIPKDTKAADVQPVNQWISVKERQPDKDDLYLVAVENEICVYMDIADYSNNQWHKHDEVIYWQPLPELPKEGDTNG